MSFVPRPVVLLQVLGSAAQDLKGEGALAEAEGGTASRGQNTRVVLHMMAPLIHTERSAGLQRLAQSCS